MKITMLLIPLFVLAVSASPDAILQHKKEMHDHTVHLKYVTDHLERKDRKGWDLPCDHPHPKVFPVHELLTPGVVHGKSYFPEETVLYRCIVSNNCCRGSTTLVPQHVDKVSLPFMATYLENFGNNLKGHWKMEYYLLDNHTSCGCYPHEEHHQPPIHHEGPIHGPDYGHGAQHESAHPPSHGPDYVPDNPHVPTQPTGPNHQYIQEQNNYYFMNPVGKKSNYVSIPNPHEQDVRYPQGHKQNYLNQ